MHFLILSYQFYDPLFLGMYERLGDCMDKLVKTSQVWLGDYEIACVFIDKAVL